jgi:Fe-S cluster assembly protein SufD
MQKMEKPMTTLSAEPNTRSVCERAETKDFPTYYRQRQAAAWERFESLPMPKRTDENWRFSDVKSLDLSAFVCADAVSDATQAALMNRSTGMRETAGKMVFANDRLLARHFHGDALKAKGVIWLPLEQAITEHRELVEKYFMRESNILGSAKFAALHEAQACTGTFIYIPRGVEVALPVEAFHWLDGANASIFPHTLIVAEDQSKVTVVDYFSSTSDAPGFVCSVNDIVVGNGAQVTYVAAQQWSRQTLAFHLNNTTVGRDASALALRLNLGGNIVRDEAVSRLRGPGGRSDMLSVTAANGEQLFDQRTLQIHETPNTASDLLYKNALNDRSRTVFTGLIRVDEGAHKTDAYQKVRNLMLSEEAEANSAPGLEIEADDVRCTHGATSGALEPDELFYLTSRGIPPRQAQQLITFGFLSEVFDRLPNQQIREKLIDLLHGKLG